MLVFIKFWHIIIVRVAALWQCWSVCRGGLHRSGDVRHVVVVASCVVWLGRAECWLVGPALERRLTRRLLWLEHGLVTGTHRVCLNNKLCSAVALGGISRALHNVVWTWVGWAAAVILLLLLFSKL